MIHNCRSTKDAYDFSNMGSTFNDVPVNTGDLLFIESEKVIGMVDTWPIALTKNHNKLHNLTDGFTLETCPDSHREPILAEYVAGNNRWDSKPDISLAMLRRRVAAAKRLAERKGWAIASYVDCQ